MPDAASAEQPPSLGRNFRNWFSWAGMVLAAAALFAFLLLIVIDQFAGHRNPYVGILAYVVAPVFFAAGLFLTLIGAILRRRSRRKAALEEEHWTINIDLSRPRDRRVLAVFVAASVIFLFLTAVGSYETYQYTESVNFCGQTCHLPMEPQFVAAQHTVHARVECVSCHVGPGAAAYFRTKINGVKQLYHAVLNDFDRPIFVSEANPRPPQAICQHCHWPERHIGNVSRSYIHYLSDEKNTQFGVRLLLNVGGGDVPNGAPGGIHWHMNISNKIEYVATDDLLTSIPWVRKTDAQGKVTEYRDPDFKDDLSKYQVRRMDCLDCHTRPAHKMESPNDAVDHALSTGRLDPNVPWVKSKVVEALVKPYATRAEAEQGISNSLREAFPDPNQANPIINEAQAIYRVNFFPEVKTDWRTHPDFIGHKNWNGCFRCHDGKHLTADTKTSIKASDCNSCHLIIAQGSGEALNQIDAKGLNFFHIDSEYSDFSCAECHTGGPQK